jgi:hypothetical protein
MRTTRLFPDAYEMQLPAAGGMRLKNSQRREDLPRVLGNAARDKAAAEKRLLLGRMCYRVTPFDTGSRSK